MDRANGECTRRATSLDLADAYAELTDDRSSVGQHGTHGRGLVQLTGVAAATMHHAGPYDVVVGHITQCPIYADLRQLELFRTRYMLIEPTTAHTPYDAHSSTGPTTRAPTTRPKHPPICPGAGGAASGLDVGGTGRYL